MSFTVFSARSIAHDLESAVGEEAFYFYMREIIERKLFKEYVDDVNGEVKQFADLIDFMTHKEGLGIKDLHLFKQCLSVIESSKHPMKAESAWLLNQISLASPFLQHGENQFTTQGGSKTTSIKGRGKDYERRRLARDYPEMLDEIGPGKRFKSVRAAAIEAGIITPFPSLQLKEPAPTAQKLFDKMGQDWCLRLLEELSELCL